MRGFISASIIVLGLAISTATAGAHVMVDIPNGGEELRVGSVQSIAWHDQVNHGPAVYNLWYSVSGPEGPWIGIASGLPPGSEDTHSYEWTVPDSPSQMVRIRVQQENSGPNYTDVSNADLAILPVAAGATVTLKPSQDATLYQGDGSLANGVGSYLFTGKTESQNGALERRALLAFDIVGAVPAGSTITAVSLELAMSRTIAGEQEVALHLVLESWTEGPSDAPGQEGGGTDAQNGDVTWVHRTFPDTVWTTTGGSFAAAASASRLIGGTGSYTYASTPQMVADVQGWLEAPSTNFGWALLMSAPGAGSAKRFDSGDNGISENRPSLVVSFEEPSEALSADFDFVPQNPLVGEIVTFTDRSLGSPTEWTWDFGDGGGSAEQSPTHAFETAGDFIVSLTVSNDGGSDTAQNTVSVLTDEGPELTELVFIPAAANASGSGVSFWVTTVDVHNPGPGSATFAFLWFPRNLDNADPERSGSFTLDPGESMRFHNLLGDVFGADSAFGAAAVVSDSAEIEVMSRTFNQSSDGTFGQSLPGVPSNELIAAGNRARILFLTENGSFRSNLGLVNGVKFPIVIQWELFDSSGAFLRAGDTELAAWGNLQINRILEDFAPLEAAYADVWTTTTGGSFTCYGSVLDQQSSDPTTILPR
jgi:PKD repeat protein